MQLNVCSSCFFYTNMTTKEEFLEKHNSLVSADMKVTMEILDCFELVGIELRPEIDEYFKEFSP